MLEEQRRADAQLEALRKAEEARKKAEQDRLIKEQLLSRLTL